MPSGTLVVALGMIAGRDPFLVEPIEARFFIRDPLLDSLPRRLDGLHGVDVEGWWWRAGKLDNPFPQAEKPQKKFDLFRLAEGADRLHGARAAGTLERITAPNFEDEVAPEGAHVAGQTLGRCGDAPSLGELRCTSEEDLGGRRFFGGSLE